MKQKYFYINRLLATTLVCGSVLATHTSCVNNDYDLEDDNLDKEVTVGGNVNLPLGNTEAITLEDLLEDEDIENLEDADGMYKITMSDSIEESLTLTEEGITLDEITVNQNINSTFESPEFPSFNFNIPNNNIDVKIDLEEIVLTEGAIINTDNKINFNLGSAVETLFNTAGNSVNDAAPLTNTETTSKLFIEGAECSKEVISVSDIKFSKDDKGSKATIKIDFTPIANGLEAGAQIVLPSLDIEFPEKFILSSGTNKISATNIEAVNGVIEYSFYVKSYDSLNNVNGKLEDIDGEIVCNLSDNIKIKGTTNGNAITSTDLDLNINTTIAIADMNLAIQDVEVPVESKNISNNVVISGISSDIKSVQEIEMEKSKMTVNISSITLASLKAQGASTIYLELPKDKFTLSGATLETTDQTAYKLPINLDKLVDGVDYSETINVEKLNFSNETLEKVTVDGKEEQQIVFNPEIKTTGETIVLGGEMSLSEFNTFVAAQEATPQKMVIDVETGSWNVKNALITTNGLVAELESSENAINITTTVPNELTEIDSVKFKNTVNANLNVIVKVDGIDSDMSFDNYTVEFPKFIKFAESAGVVDSKLVLNDQFTYANGEYTFKKALEIETLDFTDPSYNDIIVKKGSEQELIIEDAVKLSGAIELASDDVNTNDVGSAVTGDVSFVIDGMEVGKAYGIVDPEIDIEDSNIDLSEISDEFDGEVNAVLSNPTISLVATNTLTVPVEIKSLKLQPTKNGKNLEAAYTDTPIVIAAAPEGGVATTKINISAEGGNSDGDVQNIKMENIKTILNDLPDNITVTVDAGVAAPEKGENHMVDLSKDSYDLKVNYDLNVPLAFDELNIDYTTDVDGFKSDLEDVIDYITDVEIELDIENTLPISLTIDKLIPLDASGKELTGLESFIVDGANVINANSESSIVTLKVIDKDDLLKELDGLNITVKADVSSTEAGQVLRPEQYMKIKVRAKLPNGFSFDLDEL